jgi:hypothetical protein
MLADLSDSEDGGGELRVGGGVWDCGGWIGAEAEGTILGFFFLGDSEGFRIVVVVVGGGLTGDGSDFAEASTDKSSGAIASKSFARGMSYCNILKTG